MSQRHFTPSRHHKSPCVFTLETNHLKHINCVKFSDDASLLATASEDNTTKVWKINKNCSAATQVYKLQGHISSVTSVAFHPNGLFIATGSEDRTVKLWKIYDGSCVFTLLAHKHGGITSVVFDSSGEHFATTSWDMTAKIWILKDDCTRPSRVSWLKGHRDIVNSFAFNNKLAATASEDKTAMVWLMKEDYSSPTCVSILRGHTRGVSSVAFNPTNKNLLLTGGDDGAVIFWELSPDFSNMTCTATCILKLMDPKNTWDINSITIDNSGLRFLTCSWDKTAKLWLMIFDGQKIIGCVLLSTLRHDSCVFSAAFHPNYEVALTVGLDASAKFWEV
jgi:WD40 repeat protein